MREEQFLAIQFDAVWHADVSHEFTRTGGMDSLLHRLLCADALEHSVRTDPAAEFHDAGHTGLVTVGDDVSRTKFARKLLARFVPAHGNDRSAPICRAESTPSWPTAPSPTTTTVAPGRT